MQKFLQLFSVLALGGALLACGATTGSEQHGGNNVTKPESSMAAKPGAEPTACTDPRSSVCTREYRPVCGIKSGGVTATYSNACTACANPEVSAYTRLACK